MTTFTKTICLNEYDKFIFDNHAELVGIAEQLANDLVPFHFTVENGEIVLYIQKPVPADIFNLITAAL